MTNEQIDELLAFEDLVDAQILAVEQRTPFPPEPANLHDMLALRRKSLRPLAEEVKRLRETWRCFHCGFETSDKTEAAGHFGEYGKEHPLCIVWGQLSDQEKANELQNIAGQLAELAKENRTLRSTIECLEYRVDGVAAEIFSRFKGCRTIDEAWHNYDFMEGRALAAEEEVKRLRAAVTISEPQKRALGRCADLILDSVEQTFGLVAPNGRAESREVIMQAVEWFCQPAGAELRRLQEENERLQKVVSVFADYAPTGALIEAAKLVEEGLSTEERKAFRERGLIDPKKAAEQP